MYHFCEELRAGVIAHCLKFTVSKLDGAVFAAVCTGFSAGPRECSNPRAVTFTCTDLAGINSRN